MDAIQSTPHSLKYKRANLSTPTLSILGGLGLAVEYSFPSLPFGVLTSTFLIGILTVQHHWVHKRNPLHDKIKWSTIGLLSSGFCTVLACVYYLDILRGQKGTDVIAWLPIITWILSVFGVLGSTILAKQKRIRFNWIVLGFESIAHAFGQCIMSSIELKEMKLLRTKIPFRSMFINGIMPMITILFFIKIYSGINPTFGDSTNFLFEGTSWIIRQWGLLLTSLPYGTILLSMLILGGVLSSFTGTFNVQPKQSLDDDSMKKSELKTLLDTLDTVDTTESDLTTPKKWDIETLTPTLIALNALLLWFHCIDLYSIVSSDFSSPVVLSENVHACLSRVFFATTSAIAILLLPTSESQKNSHQRWAKAWIVNNGIFSIWAIVKVGMYIGICGVTTKRLAILGVFVGLAWTIKSCFTMLNTQQGGQWIFNKGIELQYLCMVASSIAATIFGIFRLF